MRAALPAPAAPEDAVARLLRSTDLVDCDLLLMDRAIRLFDRAEVDHAGLYLRPGRVAEAIRNGVVSRTLAVSARGQERILCRRLRTRPASMRPVRRRADAVVAAGHRYAYEQIVLLAFLCVVRRLPLAFGLAAFLCGVLDRAAALLTRLAVLGREPMICSEFAYRCHDEAVRGGADEYTIALAPRARNAAVGRRRAARGTFLRRGVEPGSLLALVQASPPSHRRRPQVDAVRHAARVPTTRDLEARFERYEAALGAGRSLSGGSLLLLHELEAGVFRFAAAWAIARGRRRGAASIETLRRRAVSPARSKLRSLAATAADFVTPGDLLQSGSLYTVGDLEKGGERAEAKKPPRGSAATAAAPRARRASGSRRRKTTA
jgi:hypothetical protein